MRRRRPRRTSPHRPTHPGTTPTRRPDRDRPGHARLRPIGQPPRPAGHHHRVHHPAGPRIRQWVCGHRWRHAAADARRDPAGLPRPPLLGGVRQTHPRSPLPGQNQTLRLPRTTHHALLLARRVHQTRLPRPALRLRSAPRRPRLETPAGRPTSTNSPWPANPTTSSSRTPVGPPTSAKTAAPNGSHPPNSTPAKQESTTTTTPTACSSETTTTTNRKTGNPNQIRPSRLPSAGRAPRHRPADGRGRSAPAGRHGAAPARRPRPRRLAPPRQW